MGLQEIIKKLAQPSAHSLRGRLAKAEAAQEAAADVGDRKTAEDAAWAASQLRLELKKAEARERDESEQSRLRDLAIRREGVAEAVARIERTPGLVAAWVGEVADIAARLAQIQRAILEHEEACRVDERFVADESRAIGDPPPAIRNDAPTFAVGVTRMCRQAVRARHVADGVPHTIEEGAADLVSGSTR